MTDDNTAPKPSRAETLKNLSEDTLGFEQIDLRTVLDLVLRPRQVLEGWMTGGPTADGRYARPLKLYLALNAILMLILFFRGGASYVLTGLPAKLLNPLIAGSGKTREAFLNDADGWMTLVLVPIGALLYALAIVPFLRWWDTDTLGWSRGFRAAFAYLNAWTVLMLPLSWFMYGNGLLAQLAGLALSVLGFVAFLRMGRGRWYRSVPGGIGKGAVLLVAIYLAGAVSLLIVGGVGVMAGLWF